MSTPALTDFSHFELNPTLITALNHMGMETPTQLQNHVLPILQSGRDAIVDASSGTGKTLTFALAAAQRIVSEKKETQVLVLCATREQVIAITEVLQTLAQTHFQVAPLYNGQALPLQARQIKAGAQIVVGTPSRILDMTETGQLALEEVKLAILSDADEMVKLNFMDDVESVLDYTPRSRQTVLLANTVPPRLQDVVNEQMRDPARLSLPTTTLNRTGFTQAYWLAQSADQKLGALTQLIEKEDNFTAAIVFVNTRFDAQKLTAQLTARGYTATACFAGMTIKARKVALAALSSQKLDILIATPAVLPHLSEIRTPLIFSYHVPPDVQTYDAYIGCLSENARILMFIEPQEVRQMRTLERASRLPMNAINLTLQDTQVDRGVAQLKQWALDTIEREPLNFYLEIISELENEHDLDVREIAAAFANIAQRLRPLPGNEREPRTNNNPRNPRFSQNPREPRQDRRDYSTERFDRTPRFADRNERSPQNTRTERPPREIRPQRAPVVGFSSDTALVPYRIEVGRNQGASPKEIVGAIANEGGIEGRFIGQINLYDTFSTVELPASIPADLFTLIKQIRVRQTPLAISEVDPTTLPAPVHTPRLPTTTPEGERPFPNKRRTTKTPYNRNARNNRAQGGAVNPNGESRTPRPYPPRHRRPPRDRSGGGESGGFTPES